MQQQYSSMNIFSGRIICGECGGIFGSKVWHSTSPEHRRTIWMCNRRYGKGNNKGTFCSTPHLYEPTIKKVFIDAFNKCIKNRKQIIDNCQVAMDALTDTAEIEKKLEDQRNESDVVSELVRRCVENNAHTTVNPDEYSEQYIELVKRYEAAQEKIKKYSDELRERATKRDKITAYLKTLESQKVLITEFDETLWNLTVEKMVVYSKKEIVITFKDGETVQCQVT